MKQASAKGFPYSHIHACSAEERQTYWKSFNERLQQAIICMPITNNDEIHPQPIAITSGIGRPKAMGYMPFGIIFNTRA